MGFTNSGQSRLHSREKDGRSRATAWPSVFQHASTKRVQSHLLSSSDEIEEMGSGW